MKKRQKGQAKKSWGVGSAESQKTHELLTGGKNPLVTLTFVRGLEYPRSMGFIVERFEKGLRLVVTCKHVVRLMHMPSYQKLVFFKNPKPTALTCLGDPVEDFLAENDIAFLVVHDPTNSPTQPLPLDYGLLPINGQTLFSSKNDCEPLKSSYGIHITCQQVEEFQQIAYCKFSSIDVYSVHMDNLDERRQRESEGYMPYRKLKMVSRPGYSGSPIWDKDLRLYGMHVRGSAPTDANYKETGDICICLPTHLIFQARQRMDEEIKKRIARFT